MLAKVKKLIILIMASILVLTIIACAGTSSDTPTPDENDATVEDYEPAEDEEATDDSSDEEPPAVELPPEPVFEENYLTGTVVTASVVNILITAEDGNNYSFLMSPDSEIDVEGDLEVGDLITISFLGSKTTFPNIIRVVRAE